MSNLDSLFRVNRLLWCPFNDDSRERLNRFRKAVFNRLGIVFKNGKENLVNNEVQEFLLRKYRQGRKVSMSYALLLKNIDKQRAQLRRSQEGADE